MQSALGTSLSVKNVGFWMLLHWTHRSSRPLTPSVRSSPVCPSTDNGCRTNERSKPPTNALAPAPAVTLPVAPRYLPASPPRGGPRVGAMTAHASSPPAVKPMSRPITGDNNPQAVRWFRTQAPAGHRDPAGLPGWRLSKGIPLPPDGVLRKRAARLG